VNETSPPIDGLGTEAHRDDLATLDLMTTEDLVGLMNAEDVTVPHAVAAASSEIARAIDAIAERLIADGRLLYVGAGTPGRLGVLDAAECVPTFGTDPELVQGILAGGPDAFATAAEGIEDDAAAGAKDIRSRSVGAGDAVVGISASGRTPYVLGAVREARTAGSLTVGLACNRSAELSDLVHHPIEIVTGAEVVNGSTRLKAGTAQKLVLNMISTIAGIRLGKTYGNLMVDVVASNEKLRARAQRIVRQATGCDEAVARRALEEAGGQAKVAVLIVARGIDAEEARERLRSAGGFLRRALNAGS
jgi:N-acetylmuramic acid 6-phosphate etherase